MAREKKRTDEYSTRHCAWVVIGTDGSLLSEPFWWREDALEKCPLGCHVRRYWLHLQRAPGEWLKPKPKGRKR